MEDLKAQLAEKTKTAQEAQKAELALRKRTRELEDKEQNIELELQRKLDEAKGKLQEDTEKKISEEYNLKFADKDRKLDEMRRQIEDLKRKAEQGSQQMQGEVLELEIEDTLRELFPLDQISPVAKGVKGGDIAQSVIAPSGREAGKILWEAKRTKNWSPGWIDKVKEDQRAISAEMAVIVTTTLPKELTHFGCINNVWVVDFLTFRGLALALRQNLLQVHHAKAIAQGRDENMDYIYQYLTGTKFKQRIEAIVESFRTMQTNLEKEKVAMTKAWSARQTQLDRIIESTVGMYGDLQGLVGSSLPVIPALEFESEEEEDEVAMPLKKAKLSSRKRVVVSDVT
jgi:hypothetical protein